MQPNRSRLIVSASSTALTLLLAGQTHADWPVARHDGQRTATSSSGTDIAKPGAYWRAYLAGAIKSHSLYIGDVDGDAAVDVLIASGGRLALYRQDNTATWKSPPLAILSIASVQDLNMDGVLDIVTFDSNHAMVISGASGQIEWEEPATELGTIGALLVGDVNGDGRSELVIDECGCCAVQSASPGNVYDFSAGFSNVKSLWLPPSHVHCGDNAVTLGDWDGDGKTDVLIPNNDTLTLLSGAGTQLGTTSTLQPFIGNALCEAADVDGQSGQEAICFQNTFVSGLGGGRFVAAITFKPGSASPVQILWKTDLAPSDGDAKNAGRLIADLDGDGALEVIAAGRQGSAWTTSVLDAKTGITTATLPGELIDGLAPIGNGGTWLVTRHDAVTSFWQYVSQPTPSLNFVTSVNDRRVGTPAIDWTRARTSPLSATMVAPDLNGDGKPDPILESVSEPATFISYDASSGSLIPLASYALPPGVATAGVAFPLTPGSNIKVAVSRNDGLIALLDGSFATLNAYPEFGELVPGLRSGGYYTGPGAFQQFGRAPVAGKLTTNDTADSVLVVDSRDSLVALDGVEATNVAPAKPKWRLPAAFGASIGTQASGARIGCFQKHLPATEPATYGVRILDGSGTGSVDFSLSKQPAWDVLPADVDGDGVFEFAAMSQTSSLATDVTVIDSAGASKWTSSLTAVSGTAPAAIGDWNLDGKQDLAVNLGPAKVFSGIDGSALAQSSMSQAYFMPLLYDVDQDGLLEMTLQGGLLPARTLTHDLGNTVWIGPDNQPYPYGAIANCGGVLALVEASFGTPARLSATQLSGPTAGQATTGVLAGGVSYASEIDAKAAKAKLGQLSDVAVTPDLTGTGSPGALVGSTDGYLYAINPCTNQLIWSYGFDSPVGSPILADTDGDGKDDILVSVADGYLYALRDEKLPPPAEVLDTDPPNSATNVDIDDITTVDTLYASWTTVAGADSYEVAVASGGAYISNPHWINVGNVTSATLNGLSLISEAKYVIGVRAVGTSGKSPDTISDGVVVHGPAGETVEPVPEAGPPDAAPDAGDAGIKTDAGDAGLHPGNKHGVDSSGGCDCVLGQKPQRSTPVVAFLVALLVGAVRWRNRAARRRW